MRQALREFLGHSLRGLLLVAPFGVTIALIVWFVRFLNDLISPITDELLPFHIPGLGIVVVLVGIALLGYIGSQVISFSVESWIDRVMGRAPLAKAIYFSVKDIISLFSDKSEKLGRPVRVLVQRDPVQYRFGFLTQGSLTEFGLPEGMVSVYLPLSYGIVGNQLAVDRKDVEFLDLPATEVMKFIISGGVTHVSAKEEKKAGVSPKPPGKPRKGH